MELTSTYLSVEDENVSCAFEAEGKVIIMAMNEMLVTENKEFAGKADISFAQTVSSKVQ